MSANKKNTEEEVDLGSLFVIIGKGFSNFFNFIGSLFKNLFHLIILLLLFLRSHFVKFTIAAVIGGFSGAFFDFNKGKLYRSYLKVQPNFGSGEYLYTNIRYYNELVVHRNIEELMRIFNISEPEALSLKSFRIEDIEDPNDIVESYDKLVKAVDTLTIKNYPYQKFNKNFRITNYRTHVIYVDATDNKVFIKLGDVIISKVNENPYFKEVKKLNDENLNRLDSTLKNNLKQVDSLRKTYIRVMIEESKKDFKGTNIDLGNAANNRYSGNEIELFNVENQINSRLKAVSDQKARESQIINVITGFKPVGYEVNPLSRKYKVLGVLGALILMLGLILLKDLNKYLENYKSK